MDTKQRLTHCYIAINLTAMNKDEQMKEMIRTMDPAALNKAAHQVLAESVGGAE